MNRSFTPPRQLPAWAALEAQAARMEDFSVVSAFAGDAGRFERFSFRHETLLADFSKQRIDEQVLTDLLTLAKEAQIEKGIEALFSAEAVNFTENRPALHMAFRGSCPPPAGERLDTGAWRRFAQSLWSGSVYGLEGRPINYVVNLGIGGSDLGPRMSTEALASSRSPVKVGFASSIDPRELADVLANADPAQTLFIVSSKSFSTEETISNAEVARAWLATSLGADRDLSLHFAAISNNVDAARAFGIRPERVFPLPEWVGGRYSVWSAVGLPLLLSIGPEAFDAFLSGARSMDNHFRTARPARNLPLLMGLIGLWNINFLRMDSLAVLPYAYGLRKFAAWLQQLEMESNGKRTVVDGTISSVPTAPVVWGKTGTNGQHTFHQLFYQGTRSIPMDFIVPVGDDNPRQRALVDNALAQASALMNGRDLETATKLLRKRRIGEDEVARLAPHLVCPGNQPSTTLLLPELEPYSLGQLLALYEHKVFVQGWIWGINSFDQYGVELGKEMAHRLSSTKTRPEDGSTAGLIAAVRALRDSMDAR